MSYTGLSSWLRSRRCIRPSRAGRPKTLCDEKLTDVSLEPAVSEDSRLHRNILHSRPAAQRLFSDELAHGAHKDVVTRWVKAALESRDRKIGFTARSRGHDQGGSLGHRAQAPRRVVQEDPWGLAGFH